jgi:hypothetical protein
MYLKRHEIEAIVEDLIENTVLETFAGSFATAQEGEVALTILIEKLEELDTNVFKTLFD